MDSASLTAFVGKYEIHPDYIDSVHFEGRALVATAVGQVSPGVWKAFTPGAQLVPVAPDAFVPDGVGSLIVFERDSRGHVIDYVQGYPNGFVSHARRREYIPSGPSRQEPDDVPESVLDAMSHHAGTQAPAPHR
jgi:hypothetical protein